MATLYAVSTGTIGTTNMWSTSSGGAASVTTVTAADELILNAASGAITVTTSNNTVRSLNATGFTGTLTLNNATTALSLGDATSATGNNALILVSGMTLTIGGGNSTINFISTSTTQQTITTGGKTMPNTNINGSNSSYILGGALTQTGGFTLTVGTFNTGNFNISSASVTTTGAGTKVLTLGSTTWTLTSTNTPAAFAATGLTLNAGTSTFICSPVTNAFPENNATGLTFYNLTINGTGGRVTVGNTFNDITYTGTAVKTNGVTLVNAGTLTVNGTFTVNGNSAINRVLVASATRGTVTTINAAAVSFSNVDFMDITAAGASSPWNLSSITGNSGDAGGNANITFTTAATQTATGTASFTWSTHGWTSRVPLPQDSVVVNNSFIAGRTVTLDMPRSGGNIDFSGATGNPIISFSNTTEVFGNLSMSSGSTTSGSQNLTFSGRSSQTITSNGVSFTSTIIFNGPLGTYTLQDAFTTSSGTTVSLGTLNTNNMTLTCTTFASSGSTVRGVTLGTSTINLTSTAVATIWNLNTVTNLTFSGTSSNIVIANASANTRPFSGGGLTYGTVTYTVAASTGQLTLSGSNTFSTISVSGGSRTLTLTANQTQTVTSWNVFGTAGNLVTINSSTGGTSAIISHPSGGVISNDYVSMQDIRVLQPYVFFAGTNSTNTSNNLNVNFTVPPSAPLIKQGNFTGAASGTSHSSTFVSSTTAGNLLLYIGNTQGNPGTFTPPTGFTLAKDNNQGTGTYIKMYYKVADGSETTISASWTNTSAHDMAIYEVSGFTGTPTLDVTDSNGSTTATSLSTGAGVTNTVAPAFVVASVSGQGTLGASVFGTAPTNSFQEDYFVTGGRQRVAVLPTTGTASQSTTITWTTSRVPTSILAAFIGVSAAGGGVRITWKPEFFK